MCADSIRVVQPLFHAAGGGSIPTSALQLWFSVADHDRAVELNRLWHSRFPEYGGGGSRACYVAEFGGLFYATAIWTNPTSPKLPQLQWLMLKRWAIADDAPTNTASRMMSWMVRDIRKRFPDVTTLVSYSDPDTHEGAIYRACNWTEGETTKRTFGSKRWRNRKRGRVAINKACERVTRWTKEIRNDFAKARQTGTQTNVLLPGTGKDSA